MEVYQSIHVESIDEIKLRWKKDFVSMLLQLLDKRVYLDFHQREQNVELDFDVDLLHRYIVLDKMLSAGLWFEVAALRAP